MGNVTDAVLDFERRLAATEPADTSLSDLLADDFVEVGASGRTWS